MLRQKKTITIDKNLQEIKFKNKSKALYIVDNVSYYTRTPLIFYNDEIEIISNIVIKDARLTKSKRESNNTHN